MPSLFSLFLQPLLLSTLFLSLVCGPLSLFPYRLVALPPFSLQDQFSYALVFFMLVPVSHFSVTSHCLKEWPPVLSMHTLFLMYIFIYKLNTCATNNP